MNFDVLGIKTKSIRLKKTKRVICAQRDCVEQKNPKNANDKSAI